MPPNPGDSPTSLRDIKGAGGRWRLDEFVEVVNSLVERYLPATRSLNVKLRNAFNPRLVRYYATFGLISSPERAGKEARYNYGHLLQALVTRRLLFEGYTAPALLKLLAGKTETDYEAMLAGGVSMAAAIQPMEVHGSDPASATPEQRQLVREMMASPPPIPSAPLSVKPPPIPIAAVLPAHREKLLWRRVDVAPGCELHVRADFALPETRAQRETLLLAMLEALREAR